MHDDINRCRNGRITFDKMLLRCEQAQCMAASPTRMKSAQPHTGWATSSAWPQQPLQALVYGSHTVTLAPQQHQ